MLAPERTQMVMEATCPDLLLPPEHRARQVWAFVEALDVTALEDRIKSRAGGPGAPATNPRVLLALWLYACLDGVGSARELDRLCREHSAYRWMRGQIGVNHHTLGDFRTGCGEFLDDLLTRIVASLVSAGVVEGSEIFQDGVKVRASAGSKSFRRAGTLERLHEQAAAHVARVRAQATDQQLGARVRAARLRAAKERQARVAAALETMKEIQIVKARAVKRRSQKEIRQVREARASTTDPDARIMKTRGGGSDPAYNVQFGTDGKSRAIVGVQVLSAGTDNGLSEAMRPEVERRTGVKVKTHVTDAGYLSKDTVEREESAGVVRIMPLPINPDGRATAPAKKPRSRPAHTRRRREMK